MSPFAAPGRPCYPWLDMRLSAWLQKSGRSIRWLATAAGIGYATAHRAAKGRPLKLAAIIRKVSDATGGEVTASELERGATPDSGGA